MVRSDREGVGKFVLHGDLVISVQERQGVVEMRQETLNEAEKRYLWSYEQKDWQDWAGDNSVYAVGEAVRDKVTSVIGVVLKPFAKTGLYVMFPQFDVPQLVRSANMEKLNED